MSESKRSRKIIRVKSRRRSAPLLMNVPPSLSLVPTLGHCFRFINTSNASVPVTVTTLLGSLGVIGTSVTSTASMASSVRISHINVWPPAGGTALAEWGYAEGHVKDAIKDSSLPTGITISKMLKFSPPPNLLASFWSNEVFGAQNILNLICSVGSVVDVHVSYTIAASFQNVLIPVATAVLGTVYYLALDGPTSNLYVPVGLPTTH
jgi:hypothetical protein